MRKAALCGLFSYIDELVNLIRLTHDLKRINHLYV